MKKDLEDRHKVVHSVARPTGMSRRRFLSVSAALAVGASAGLLSRPLDWAHAADVETIDVTPSLIAAAKREGIVLFRHGSPMEQMNHLADAFKKRFGVEVQLDRKVGVIATGQFATEERAGQHVVDVMSTADPVGIIDLGKEGLLLPFTLVDIDKKLDKGQYMPDLGYFPTWNRRIISYNPAFISHAQAKKLFKTWHGLLDPSLKGRIGMADPGGSGAPFALCLMFYRRPEYGREFVVKIGEQKPRIYVGSGPLREALNSGAISVFFTNTETNQMGEFMEGSKIAWTYPEIAPCHGLQTIAISKGAPHPNAARLFVAWHFTPEGARAMQEIGQEPMLKGVPDTRPVLAALKKTDWWEPYPTKICWKPDLSDWYKNYAALVPDMYKALGYQKK